MQSRPNEWSSQRVAASDARRGPNGRRGREPAALARAGAWSGRWGEGSKPAERGRATDEGRVAIPRSIGATWRRRELLMIHWARRWLIGLPNRLGQTKAPACRRLRYLTSATGSVALRRGLMRWLRRSLRGTAPARFLTRINTTLVCAEYETARRRSDSTGDGLVFRGTGWARHGTAPFRQLAWQQRAGPPGARLPRSASRH